MGSCMAAVMEVGPTGAAGAAPTVALLGAPQPAEAV